MSSTSQVPTSRSICRISTVTMMPSTSSIVFQNFCIFFSSIGGKNPKGMNRRMFPKKFVGEKNAVCRAGKNPQIVFDYTEGNEIQMLPQLNRVGERPDSRGSQKQKKKHTHAIQKGKNGNSSLFF